MLRIDKLKKRKHELQEAYAEARRVSIEMDSKMQSRYDTQKEDWARRAEIIDHLIVETQKQVDYLENLPMPSQNVFVEIGHVVTVQEEDDIFSLLLVDGIAGGIKLEDIQLVSMDAPIGKAILGHSQGDKLIILTQDEKNELSILSIGVIA